ncbi:MAG: hypothetical protein O7G83_15415, partial [Proteobacteria bacterium]|nr:hypothetical protein [Pseudomonadota bacterium]
DRLLDGDVNHYLLAKAMGNTVRMIEQHYGDIEPQQKAAQLTRSKDGHMLAARAPRTIRPSPSSRSAIMRREPDRRRSRP